MDQESNVTGNGNQSTPTSWRDVLPVHPAANLLPRMSDAELKELGADIFANGLHTPVVILLNDEDGSEQLLDGVNRLDAMERADIEVVKDGRFNYDRILHQHIHGNTDPVGFVLSVNLYRRHLSNDQKTELIQKILPLKPTASDRQIASMTGTSHPKVAKVRRDLEAGGKIPTSPTRTDKRGREQPATKPSTPATTPDITAKPAVKPEPKAVEPDFRTKESDAHAPLWDVIEAIDRVIELERQESTQTALGTITQTSKKKITKSLRELCAILKILRGEVAKVVNVTEPGDIKTVGTKPITSSADVDAALKNWHGRLTCELVDRVLAIRQATGRGVHLAKSQWRTVHQSKKKSRPTKKQRPPL